MSDTMILIYYSGNSDELLNNIDEDISVHNVNNEEEVEESMEESIKIR